jgi:hypothetical protein
LKKDCPDDVQVQAAQTNKKPQYKDKKQQDHDQKPAAQTSHKEPHHWFEPVCVKRVKGYKKEFAQCP